MMHCFVQIGFSDISHNWLRVSILRCFKGTLCILLALPKGPVRLLPSSCREH